MNIRVGIQINNIFKVEFLFSGMYRIICYIDVTKPSFISFDIGRVFFISEQRKK